MLSLFKNIRKGISKAFKGLKKAVKKITFKKAFKVIAAIGVALVAPALLGNMMTGLGGAMASSSSALVSTIGNGISALGTAIGGTAATAGGPGFLSRTFSSVSGTISSGIEKVSGFFKNPTKAGTEVLKDLAVDKAQDKFEEETGINPEVIGAVVQQGAAFANGITNNDALEEITVTAKRRGPLGDPSPSRLTVEGKGLGEQAAINIEKPLRASDALQEITVAATKRDIPDDLGKPESNIFTRFNLQDQLREEIGYQKDAARDAVKELVANKITGADIKSAQQDAANNPYNTLNQPNFVRGDSPYMAADTSGLAPTMNHAPTQAYIQNQNSMQNSLQQQGISYGPTPSFIANAYHFQPIA